MDLKHPNELVLESYVEVGLLRPDGTVEWRIRDTIATPEDRVRAEKGWQRHISSLGLPPAELRFVSRTIVTVSILHDGLLEPGVTIDTEILSGAKFPRLDNDGKPLPFED